MKCRRTTVCKGGTVILLSVALLAAVGLRANDVAADLPLYEIGPGDEIFVNVFGLSDFDVQTRVSNSGRVHVPYVGVISVLGETTRSLGLRLEDELSDRGLVSEPSVRVNVSEHGAQPVYALGEVMTPGQFMITDTLFLTDLIGLASGLNDQAGGVGYLYRRQATRSADQVEQPDVSSDGTVDSVIDEVITIEFDQLYSDGGTNVKLQGGDLFFVPERNVEYFYVIGDVLAPGRKEIPQTGPVFGVRALAMAGGPLKTAKLAKSVLVTRGRDGGVSYDEINLKQVFQGERDDFTMQAGQILFVPGSASKSLAYGLMNAVPGMAVIY